MDYNFKKSEYTMSSKTDALYIEMLKKRVVSFDEIVSLARELFGRPFNGSYIYNKYLRRLVKEGRLKRIRRGLYVAMSPLEEEPSIDNLLVASKIRPEYFLGFHTALEFYGCAYSAHNETYICVRPESRFNPFEFGRLSFRPVFVDDVDLEVEEKNYRGHELRVSGKERTFVDCLERVEYAGGWEEALKSFQNLSGLDFEKIQSLTVKAENDMLLRRAGYVLELLKERSMFYEHLPEEVLERLAEKISEQTRYLVQGIPGSLNPKWRLYIPEGFEGKLTGV